MQSQNDMASEGLTGGEEQIQISYGT